MKIKAVISLLSVLGITFMMAGSTIGSSYNAIYTDQDSYNKSETIVITYDGLGGASYSYPVKIVVLDDAGEIVATSALLPEVSGYILFEWNWDQTLDDGSTATGGTYYVTGAYYYDGGVIIWGSFDSYNSFTIGHQGPSPAPGPGPKP